MVVKECHLPLDPCELCPLYNHHETKNYRMLVPQLTSRNPKDLSDHSNFKGQTWIPGGTTCGMMVLLTSPDYKTNDLES